MLVERSVSGASWQLREADARQVAALVQRHRLPEALARLLAARGVTLEDAPEFLNPSLRSSLPDPSHLRDMDSAAERIAAAVMAGETIAIFGDYDVDGATSSALLCRFFRMLGREALVYIPDRIAEGYGPNTPALLKLKAQGASVVITVDCGTLAFEPLAAAHEAGLDVIVVDHHAGEAALPKAFAVVNPNRLDETSPHRQMAAVGVAFLLAVAVSRALRHGGWFASRPEPDLMLLLDLVALGTVCDVVPLVGVNRAFVTQGLKVMAQRRNAGLRALMDVSRLDEKPTAYHAGFVLGPRVNAGGRVGKAPLGAQLLSCDDDAAAASMARELDIHNQERKAIEAMVLEQATLQAEEKLGSEVLLVAGEGWHPGVIGIVAGRLKEKYYLPTAVVAFDQGVGKASARSVSGFDFGAAVIAARQQGLLLAGGGHAMAAGFTVEQSKLQELHNFLNQRMRQSGVVAAARSLRLDASVGVGGLNITLAESLEQAGPFGAGNPGVKLHVPQAKIAQASVVGDGHVKVFLADPHGAAGRVMAFAFRSADTELGRYLLSSQGKTVQLAVELRLKEWMGNPQANVTILDAA